MLMWGRVTEASEQRVFVSLLEIKSARQSETISVPPIWFKILEESLVCRKNQKFLTEQNSEKAYL